MKKISEGKHGETLCTSAPYGQTGRSLVGGVLNLEGPKGRQRSREVIEQSGYRDRPNFSVLG